jgi:mannosyl-3-phosphoglycerate phosphatase
LKSALDEISKKHHYQIRGFHNSSLAEVQEKTKLGKVEAQRAMRREFSIPLFFDKQAEKILNREVEDYQLKLLYGGRFMHLLGKTDKGQAIRIIIDAYRKKYPGADIKSLALGDSLNDEAMLRSADYPVLVKKHDSSYEQRIKFDKLIYSPDIGPAGWNESVLSFIE